MTIHLCLGQAADGQWPSLQQRKRFRMPHCYWSDYRQRWQDTL